MPRLTGTPLPISPTLFGGAGSPVSADLGFHLPQQEESQWCWAATGLGIAAFYNPAITQTQCQIASSQLGLACCNAERDGHCNRPWYLDRTLVDLGHYAGLVIGPLPYAELKTEIDGTRPVGIRIGWLSGGGHFLAAVGYQETDSRQLVAVTDPWFRGQPRYIEYDELVCTYQANPSGTWTHSFLTARIGRTATAPGTAIGRGQADAS